MFRVFAHILLFVKIMEVLMSLQGTHLEDDDPTTSYLLQVQSISKRSELYSYHQFSKYDLIFLVYIFWDLIKTIFCSL
jgi:hypothetical protein